MDATLWLTDDDPAQLRSLQDWLEHDPQLRGRVKMHASEPRPERMGAVADVLVVALGSGGAVTAMAMAVGTWLKQPRRSDLAMVVEAADGRRVEVNAQRVERPEELISRVLGNTTEP